MTRKKHFRGDPKSSARARRAIQAASLAPTIQSGGQVTVSTGISVDANGLLNVGSQTGELIPVAASQTINGIYTPATGDNWRRLQFGANCILVYSSNFILPGGDSIETINGDVGLFYCASGTANAQGVWLCVQYTRGGAPPVPDYLFPPATIATVTNLGTFGVDWNYNNGTNGIGATITFAATGAQAINSITLAQGDVVLVKDEPTLGGYAAANGLYLVTTAGDVGVAPIWTRHIAMDTAEKFVGAIVFVLQVGTVNQTNCLWFCKNSTPPVVGTDNITFANTWDGSQLSSAQIWVGSASNYATARTLSGSGATISLSNTGVLTISAIPNASLTNSSITVNGTTISLGGSYTVPFTNTIIIQDLKSKGTDGGGSTSGSDQVRVLNSSSDTGSNLVSLSSNQFTLKAGTYRIFASAPFFQGGRCQIWLYDNTNSVVVLVGDVCFTSNAGAYASGVSRITGIFTLASQAALSIAYRCQNSIATNGLGVSGNYATPNQEVYTTVCLEY